MKVVYISHPLSAPTREEMEQNRKNAARWVAMIARECGVAPVADWITLSGEWDEATGRELGLKIDCAQIERCDELWLVGGRVSAGMEIERAHAYQFGIPVFDFTYLGYEPVPVLISEERQPLGSTHADLTGEVLRARKKFPGSRFMLAALGEEFGELCQAILQKKPRSEIQKEALQVACCAVRLLEEGDPSFDGITDEEAKK